MYTAAVITVSDKGSTGEREDLSGAIVREILEKEGYEIAYSSIIPDEQKQIEQELIKCADELKIALVLTTGGTGFSTRDVTPEATIAVCTRMAPGIPEAMRAKSLRTTNRAMLTRQQAGLRGSTLFINLPGSPKAARENLAVVLPALEHGLEMLLGTKQDCATPWGIQLLGDD